MSISVKCECGKKIRADDRLAGKRIKCPGCGKVLVVPGPAIQTGTRAEKSGSLKPVSALRAASRDQGAFLKACAVVNELVCAALARCAWNTQAARQSMLADVGEAPPVKAFERVRYNQAKERWRSAVKSIGVANLPRKETAARDMMDGLDPYLDDDEREQIVEEVGEGPRRRRLRMYARLYALGVLAFAAVAAAAVVAVYFSDFPWYFWVAAAVPWILLEGLLMGGASIGADKAAGMKLSAAGLLYLAFTTSRVRRASKPAVDEVLVNLLYRAATGRTVPSWATEVDDREDEDEEDKELQRRFDEAMTKGKHAAEPPASAAGVPTRRGYGEVHMGSSRDVLVAQIMALSVRKHVGQNVDAEVKKILSQCQTEEDKKHILTLCRGLGLN